MQHINDNDMDELFQKAAENYPLKIENKDWEKVAQKLGSSSSTSVSRKFNKRYLSILAILFFLVVGSFYATFYFTNKKIIGIAQKKNNNPGVNVSPNNNNVRGNENQRTRYIEPARVQIQGQANASVNNYNLNHSERVAERKFNTIITSAPITNDQATNERRTRENSDNTNELLNSHNVPIATDNNTMMEEKNNLFSQPQISISENKPEEKSIRSAEKESASEDKPSAAKNKAGGFYGGVIFGPQLNQVKSQGFNKVGGELGLLVGYSLSKKISIESGLTLSNKKYYSDGQYFSMEKISPTMPPSMKILTVESKATVLEIPLKGRYNLITKKNGNLFITAGASSYLLLHEQNNYQALVNGGQESLKGDYGTMRQYFATSINLSIGYEKKIGEKALLRIEPYLELPLKGLGVGSMSVFGTGLHFGLSLPVKKN
jgi:hypothetical protein